MAVSESQFEIPKTGVERERERKREWECDWPRLCQLSITVPISYCLWESQAVHIWSLGLISRKGSGLSELVRDSKRCLLHISDFKKINMARLLTVGIPRRESVWGDRGRLKELLPQGAHNRIGKTIYRRRLQLISLTAKNSPILKAAMSIAIFQRCCYNLTRWTKFYWSAKEAKTYHLHSFMRNRRKSTFTSRVTEEGKWTCLKLQPKGWELLVLIYETASEAKVVSVAFLYPGEMSVKPQIVPMAEGERKDQNEKAKFREDPKLKMKFKSNSFWYILRTSHKRFQTLLWADQWLQLHLKCNKQN